MNYPCIDTSEFEGQCTLGLLGPQGISITVTITEPHPKWATGLIPASIGAAVGLAAPWIGFIYPEATLTNLTKSLANLAQDTSDALQNFQ